MISIFEKNCLGLGIQLLHVNTLLCAMGSKINSSLIKSQLLQESTFNDVRICPLFNELCSNSLSLPAYLMCTWFNHPVTDIFTTFTKKCSIIPSEFVRR